MNLAARKALDSDLTISVSPERITWPWIWSGSATRSRTWRLVARL